MVDVTIKLDSARLEASLARAIEGAQDLRQPMGEIAAEWRELVDERFDAAADPMGVPWAKRRGKEPHPLLQLSRHLRNAISLDFGSDFAVVGVLKTAGPAIYARIHNQGGVIKHPGGTAYEAPSGKRAKFLSNASASLTHSRTQAHDITMPKRQFLGIGPKEQAVTTDILAVHLRGLFGEAE